MLCCGSVRATADAGGSPAASSVSLPDPAGINEWYQSETMPESQVDLAFI